MFQDPTSTTVADGWRTNPDNPPPLPSEGVLLISGPSEVEVSAESDPIVISFYGRIVGTLAVTLTFGGADVVPSDTAFDLTAGSPTATITVTPSELGAATVTATVAGLAEATFSYEVVSPLPVPDMDLWKYKVDPEVAWGGTHGTNYLAEEVLYKINVEFDAAGSDTPTNPTLANPTGYKLKSAIGTYNGAAGSPSFGTTMTATELQHGQATPTFPLVARIADPGGGGFTMFKHRHKRSEHYWSSGNKWRTQFSPLGVAASIPWGTELWCAYAFRATADQILSSPGAWNMIFQLHQGSSSRIKGGPLEFWLDGGNGVAGNARLWYWIAHYRNPNWLAGDYNSSSAYIAKVQNSTITVPVQDEIYYLIMNYREGCGYTDPAHGAIYGTVGSYSGGTDPGNDYFVRVWYAAGSGPAIQAAPEWRGHWGSPHNPTHAAADDNVLVDGVLTNQITAAAHPGIYQTTDMLPAAYSSERTLVHRGARVWEHQPGMTQQTVLTAFRGS